ncbi:hypothetical protein TWF730_008454 [Orbilia blumenaviensis]|uniref:ubiquitinyl hydrolase 1 n=1 Tax=Orbilia blumenaviensis TaxID=1796055 RepID=A0AAV9V3L0_9PEZI
MGDTDIGFLIQHIVLPPSLPQEEPEDIADQNFRLLKFVSEVSHNYARLGYENTGTELRKACKILKWMVDIHSPNKDFKHQLANAILGLENEDAFTAYIVGQNAGVTFRRIDESLQLETFEVSPLPEEVIGCKGHLKCSYPGATTAIPLEVAREPTFLKQLGEFLHHMTNQEFTSETLPKSRKGGNDLPETRSTADPRFIVELFTGMMRGIGKETTPRRITKSIRDEVNWKKASKPWRRSGMWLAIRVALQTTLSNKQYKWLILEIIRAVLERAVNEGHESFAISCAAKKLARRCQKIEKSKFPTLLFQRVIETTEAVSRLLNTEWDMAIAQSTRNVSWDSKLSVVKNLTDNRSISLPNSLPWIQKRLHAFKNPETTNKPIEDPTENRRFLRPGLFPCLGGNNETAKAISLIDFEIWVHQNLDNWWSETTNDQIIEVLSSKIPEYHQEAIGRYKGRNILDVSRMILTILEMWVCLDMSICIEKPLMEDYPPEIPLGLLEPLLFIQKADMKRVKAVEDHISRRHSEANSRRSIFDSKTTGDSFASKYYTTSDSLKALRRRIIDGATRDRAAKIEELERQNARYTKLMGEAQQIGCNGVKLNSGEWEHRAWSCKRCCLLQEARNINIYVHEWPLPEDEVQARSILFELQPPRNFVLWRDTTYYIMMDVCETDLIQNSETAEACELSQWEDLRRNRDDSRYSRITWASTAKPISVRSHYRTRKIPAAQGDVVVKHAGHFQLRDLKSSRWVESQHKTCNIKSLCKSSITDHTYNKFSYAVNDVVHTPNEIIARQFECPSSLTLREYDAFTTLRSGRYLQWHNILIEMHKKDLSFNKEPVYLLILHAACHLGKASDLKDWDRDSHSTLSQEAFSKKLLGVLKDTVRVLKENWEQANALKLFILLAQRLLSCGHQSVQKQALEFMKQARKVCDPWIASIREKIGEAEEEKKIQNLRGWLLKIAAIQYSTFDIDEDLLSRYFCDKADIVDYLVCQNTIYDNCLGNSKDLDHDLSLLLERNRRFSVLAEPHVQGILKGNTGGEILFSTIKKLLPGIQLSGTWVPIQSPANRWWVLRPCATTEAAGCMVHLNVLEGKLLVNGQSNGRLPGEYFAHNTYRSLLGKRILDVIQSSDPGMSYETKLPFCGVKLFFHLNGDSLIIRKKSSAAPSKYYEFIASKKFDGDIPAPILQGGTQWLDLSGGRLAFYQRAGWWQDPCPQNDWILDLSFSNRMTRNDDSLLDINGNVHAKISKILEPIEAKAYIVTTIAKDNSVTFSLPRYKLDFFLRESCVIECRGLRGWVIDQDQNIGTFIGLRSFLKLRQYDMGFDKESVLIPYGKIEAGKSGNGHCSVTILPPAMDRSYALYQIDRILNRVVDDGSLKARYTRLYLHALCSGLLPDPLTGRTGIDEALEGLRNAASFSFQTLEENEASILRLIANLTPNRHFYPRHLEVMQEVDWRESLPVWVQDDNFYPLVVEIFNDWSRRQFFLDESTKYKDLEYGSIGLLDRARYRNSVFSPGDPESKNRMLHSRHHQLRHAPGALETEVYDISRASFQWVAFHDLETDPLRFFKEVGRLSGVKNEFIPSYNPEVYASDPILKWCDLYSWCQNCTKRDRFSLLFTFSSWIYRGAGSKRLFKSLLSIAASGSLHHLNVPEFETFWPRIGLKPERSFIRNSFHSECISFQDSDYSSFNCNIVPKNSYESHSRYSERRGKAYTDEVARQADAAAAEIMSQSTDRYPNNPRGSYSLLNIGSAMRDVSARFAVCHRNRVLFRYFEDLGGRLQNFDIVAENVNIFDATTIEASCAETGPKADGLLSSWSLSNLLEQRHAPDLGRLRNVREDEITTTFFDNLKDQLRVATTHSGKSIRPTILKLKDSIKPFAKKYAEDLLKSIEALEGSESLGSLTSVDKLASSVLWYQQNTADCLHNLFTELQGKLSPLTKLQKLLGSVGLWPTLTKLDILQELRLKRRKSSMISQEWMKAILCFGEAITWLQRSTRLCHYQSKNAVQDMEKEIHNFGNTNWKVEDYIDWLLFEIDSEMLIRPVQAEIAQHMMRDEENGNAVMQLNMGEGKSAVIMPVVAAALADTTKLVRPIVLKPLSTQMFQILVERLSGLCDRRIYFLPFHRGLDIDPSHVAKLQELYSNCRENGDVLLSLPEHLLSFKLMGLEKLLQGCESLSDPLIETQKWLDTNTRDVLDESDEILHIRYQLIYTIGAQEPLEGDQDRWTVIQDLLDYLQEVATEWAANKPSAIEVRRSEAARYPTIRIIDKDIGEKMLTEMAKEICINASHKMPSVSSKLRLVSRKLREMVFQFVSVRDISEEIQETILRDCEHLRVQLLVLRGLIADGVLLFILRDKRYRVDYGLDPKRSNLAVPYRAKDRPAVKAEFGHPEVVLILTCLSYYYGGLEYPALENCFDLLLKTDDPDLTYENWTSWTKRYQKVLPSFSGLRGLNLLDEDQKTKTIFPFFKYNKHIIDFFLSELIFPREAKGFPHKLSTSGWDIAQRKDHNTTGFSGTNDNRYLLPTSIQQLDLPQQLHTNSLVLMNILKEENNTVIKAHKNGQRLNASEMLQSIVDMKEKVRVLLDVGAQILELTNREVAQEWLRLEKSNTIHGAIFFGENDELLVMRRDGKIEPFSSSSLSKQLDEALVYLDEAHTRGTDIKLLVDTRAAVTLGPNLAKDKFVQGCMRMRKLGNGHSLTFLASPDIYAHIQTETGKNPDENISVSDILLWTMEESCRQIHHGFSIWADQGFQYLQRKKGWEDFEGSGNQATSVIRKATVQPESRPLLEMYGIANDTLKVDPAVLDTPDGRVITKRLEEFSVVATNSVRVQEEQEREVDHEVEEETNVERPLPAKAKEHRLAPELVKLVKHGIFEYRSTVFKDPFSIFKDTKCQEDLEMEAWAVESNQFVTTDFAETIERGYKSHMDDYLRPVRWVVEFSDNANNYLLYISPYEANELMPDFKISPAVQLHCYAPRVSRGMTSFDRFDICPIQWLPDKMKGTFLDNNSRMRLNLFAGQLFFENEQYYKDLCKYLGLDYSTHECLGNRGNDGWVLGTKMDDYSTLPFSRSPLPFLRAAVKMRRKGQGFSPTHLGGLLDSRVLGTHDFQ